MRNQETGQRAVALGRVGEEILLRLTLAESLAQLGCGVLRVVFMNFFEECETDVVLGERCFFSQEDVEINR